MVWDGIERRNEQRRGCEWPACGAAVDADTKHGELRRDLGEIKLNQKENIKEFQNLAATMREIIALRRDIDRIEAAHALVRADIKTLNDGLASMNVRKANASEVEGIKKRGMDYVWQALIVVVGMLFAYLKGGGKI